MDKPERVKKRGRGRDIGHGYSKPTPCIRSLPFLLSPLTSHAPLASTPALSIISQLTYHQAGGEDKPEPGTHACLPYGVRSSPFPFLVSHNWAISLTPGRPQLGIVRATCSRECLLRRARPHRAGQPPNFSVGNNLFPSWARSRRPLPRSLLLSCLLVTVSPSVRK